MKNNTVTLTVSELAEGLCQGLSAALRDTKNGIMKTAEEVAARLGKEPGIPVATVNCAEEK